MRNKNHLISLIITGVFHCIAISLEAQDQQSYLITKKGEKINISGYVEHGRCPNGLNDCLNYQNEKGKDDYKVWDKIERVNGHGRYYLSFPVDEKGKKKELMELVLQNGKYKLFRWFGPNQFDKLYIYDTENKLVEKDIKLTKGKIQTGMKLDSEENNMQVMNLILKYFPDCADLKARMTTNYNNKVNLLNMIGYRACENAPDPEGLFNQ